MRCQAQLKFMHNCHISQAFFNKNMCLVLWYEDALWQSKWWLHTAILKPAKGKPYSLQVDWWGIHHQIYHHWLRTKFLWNGRNQSKNLKRPVLPRLIRLLEGDGPNVYICQTWREVNQCKDISKVFSCCWSTHAARLAAAALLWELAESSLL